MTGEHYMKVIKVLNNNVVIANHNEHREVILVGKGIGFNKATGNDISLNSIEKTFVLHDEKEKVKYKELLANVSDQVILCMDEVMQFLRNELGELPQELLVNLTDHVAFAVKRLQSGMVIRNPFLFETKLLYLNDFLIAKQVCQIISRNLKIELPEDETGFIALYIHSASQNKKMKDVLNVTNVVGLIVELVESELHTTLNKEGLYYSRFIHHLQFTIGRVKSSEYKEIDVPILKLIKSAYSECYTLAQKIGKVLEDKIGKEVFDSELVYMSMHLERIIQENSK